MVIQVFAPSPLLLRSVKNEALSGRRLRSDRCFVRLHPGVYAATQDWGRLLPWQRYLARVHAVAIAWPDAILFRESAAAVLGLPLFGECRDVHLLDPDARATRRYGAVVVHASGDEREVTVSDGLRMTAVGHTALDIARVCSAAVALATMDAALRRLAPDGVEVAHLQAIAGGQTNRRGLRKLAWVWPRTTPVAESVGESVSRAVIEWLGFGRPELQQKFSYEGVDDRVDFFWRHELIVGESDGYGKYDASDPAAAKAALIAEKVREDRLRRHLRGFARWDWRDTVRAAPLGDKLHRAGLVAARPPDREMLATLAHIGR